MTKQDRLWRLWEQDGDLELMKKFFGDLAQDEEKERIKQMVLAKLDQEENQTDVKQDELGAPFKFAKGQERANFRSRLKVTWRDFKRRWGWKMAVPVVAVFLIAMIGNSVLSGSRMNRSSLSRTTGDYAQTAQQPATSNGAGSFGAEGDNNKSLDPAAPVAGGGSQDAIGGSAPVHGSASQASKASSALLPVPPTVPPADTSLPRKITRNLSTTLQVEDIPAAVKKLNNLATTVGGYTVDSQLDNQQNSSNASAKVTLKIPADKFAGMSDSLAAIGKILSEHIVADDITNQYYDTDTRLKDWQAEEQRYLDILQKAKTVNDIMQVESSLSNIRMQIEQLKGQLKLWDNQVAYSTIQVQLQTKPNVVKVEEPWQPIAWHTTWDASKNAVLKTISVTWNLLNYLVVGIGYMLPFIILGGAGFWGYRHFYKR